MTWRDALAATVAALEEAGVANAANEARWMVEHACGYEGAELGPELDRKPIERQRTHLDQMVARRLAGEPLQYALGRWSFRHLDLMVDARVLVPRPETEQVAEWAIEQARARITAGVVRVADLGTGSGAIGLSVVREVPEAEVWATDVSADALVVATANTAALGRAAARVRLVAGWWYEALDPELEGTFDVIVSNPPYVADDDDLPEEVADHEPATALFSGPAGTESLDVIIDRGPAWLAADGVLVVEHAPHQAGHVLQRAADAGFAAAEVRNDLAGRPRALVAWMTAP